MIYIVIKCCFSLLYFSYGFSFHSEASTIDLEKCVGICISSRYFLFQTTKPRPVAYQSGLGITLSHQIQHPIFQFFVASTVSDSSFFSEVKGLKTELPCDTHMLNLKTLPKNIQNEAGETSALLLHRIGYDCHFNCFCNERRVCLNYVFYK